MQTIGAYMQPQGIESISRHSMNFYEAQWQRHQMELSHTLYPRSNTISVISDFSSDSSYGGSAPGSPSSIPALPAKRRVKILCICPWKCTVVSEDISLGVWGHPGTRGIQYSLSLVLGYVRSQEWDFFQVNSSK